jgi:hypothetical protein
MNYIERAKIDAILRTLRDLEMLDAYGVAVDDPHFYMTIKLEEALRASATPKVVLKHICASRPEFSPSVATLQAAHAKGVSA